MSFPTIPLINPSFTLTREQSALLLLSSIAFEELALAHVINAEAEKLQSAVGTLGPNSVTAPNFNSLITINQSVDQTLRTVLKNEMLLQFKLEESINILPPPPSPPVSTCPCSATIRLAGGDNTLATSPRFSPQSVIGRVSGQLRVCDMCNPQLTFINYNFVGEGNNLEFDSQGALNIDCTLEGAGIVTVSGQGRATGTGFNNELVNFTLIYDQNLNQVSLELRNLANTIILYFGVTIGTVTVGSCS